MFSSSAGLLLDVLAWWNNWIGRVIYGLIGGFFIDIINTIQKIFRMVAGLDGGMKINGVDVGANGVDYDIAYYLISSDIVKEIFFSMIIFSFFLMIIMTVLALIRNQYQDKQKAPTAILGKMFTAMVNTIIFTAFVVLGLMFSNVMLQVVDKGTSFGGSDKVSTTLFMGMAYNANKLRISESLDGDELEKAIVQSRKDLKNICAKTNFANINQTTRRYCSTEYIGRLNVSELNELADILDDAFCQEQIVFYRTGKTLSPSTSWDTETLYNLWECNYLIILVGGCMIIGILVKMSWGLIGRLFKLCFNFVLIPVVHAMTPFDDGKSLTSLKTDIVKNITMAYAPVASLNLYFSILPLINSIEFSGGFVSGIMTYVLKIALSLIGLYSMSSLTKTVNSWFGTGDVLAEGDATWKTLKDGWKSTTGKVGAVNKKVTGLYGGIVGGRKAAIGAGQKSLWGQTKGMLRGGFAGVGLDKTLGTDNFSISKGLAAGRKAGGEYADARMLDAIDLSLDGKTPRADFKKAKIDLAKFDDTFQKQLANMSKDDQVTAKAESEVIQKIAQRGGTMKVKTKDANGNLVDTTIAIAKADQELKEQQSKIDKMTANRDTMNSTSEAQQAFDDAINEAKVAGLSTLNEADIVAYDKGTYTLPGGRRKLSDGEREVLNKARDAYRARQKSAQDALLAWYRQDDKGFNDVFGTKFKSEADFSADNDFNTAEAAYNKLMELEITRKNEKGEDETVKAIKVLGEKIAKDTAEIRNKNIELRAKKDEYERAKAEVYDNMVKGKDDDNLSKLKM